MADVVDVCLVCMSTATSASVKYGGAGQECASGGRGGLAVSALFSPVSAVASPASVPGRLESTVRGLALAAGTCWPLMPSPCLPDAGRDTCPCSRAVPSYTLSSPM